MTELRIPSQWGGQSELWRGLRDVSVEGGVLDPADPDNPARRVITHDPGAALTVRWRVIQDRDGRPNAAERTNYRPWLQPTYVHLLGDTVFITPERDADPISLDSPVSVDISAPEGWEVASDLQRETLPLRDLWSSVIVAGDFRVSTFQIDGADVRVAVRGDMNDAVFRDATRTAILSNLEYWGAPGEPYLVTALTLETSPGWTSLGGTNLGDAFAFFSTVDAPEDTLRRILVHEHAHTWVPSRLGGLTQGPEQPGDYWFSEGFTDFVTTRAGLLSGAWDVDGAIAHWNDFLTEYMENPERAAPNAAIRDGFWTSAELNRLPYLRGKLYAGLIDHTIRVETGGAQDLDDVLFALRADPSGGPAAATFVDAVREVTGVDITDLHARHIDAGEPIMLPPDNFGSCDVVESGEEPVFVYGMELAENPDGDGFVIVGVDPEGPAAGVFEPGMIILERVAGTFGDATTDTAFRVLADGQEQVLSYRPTNGEVAQVQRLVPADGAVADPACFEVLAGRARS